MNYTVQKPARSDYRQNVESVQRWKEETLPAVKKKQPKRAR
jgi:hypothetical protein